MNYHFTYNSDIEVNTLKQGDLLYRTENIDSVLKKIHPYYLKKSFKYYIILTQSCDLVRRDGKNCNARYISLAAVLPFDNVFRYEISKHQNDEIESIASLCDESKRSPLSHVLESILNNNHKEFFYLNEDNDLGLTESCCAVLRLSIAIRANEHYDKCLEAKILELNDEFRAKLGWLVGNIYSRVGTKDWAPEYKTHGEFRKIKKDILDSELYWVNKEKLKALKKELTERKIDITNIDRVKILELVQSIKIPSKKEKVLDVIREKLENSNIIVKGANVEKLIARIKSDPNFASNVK